MNRLATLFPTFESAWAKTVTWWQARSSREQWLLGIMVVLLVLWLLGFFAFHVTASMIHILLVIALVLVVLHFMRGRRI